MGVRGDGSASASAQDKVVGAEIFLEAVRPYVSYDQHFGEVWREILPTFWWREKISFVVKHHENNSENSRK
jgi:hypothetical protein